METSQFAIDLRRRVREARQALSEAENDEDFDAVGIRAGELKSLIRMAVENGVNLEELRDSEHHRSAEA